jgi:ABC-2 type transport system ATP-binding protein
MPILTVRDAHKSFGATVALQGVSLELHRGELLGLLGPNGAGKTTLVRAISGMVRLDRGQVVFGEMEPPGGATGGSGASPAPGGAGATTGATAARPHLGLVTQEIALYPLLTARENLEVSGRFNGLTGARLRQRVDWALEWTGLGDRSREPVGRFSGGMRRRINIACGVLHEPAVVLLDEPTAGVDPQSRERIYDMLEGLRSAGATLLLTTHQLEEAEARCPRILIIDHGKVVASGTLAELVAQTVGSERLVTITLDQAPAAPIAGFQGHDGGRRLEAPVADVAADLPRLIRAAEAGGRILDVQVRAPSLQSVFIHLTGRELRE